MVGAAAGRWGWMSGPTDSERLMMGVSGATDSERLMVGEVEAEPGMDDASISSPVSS